MLSSLCLYKVLLFQDGNTQQAKGNQMIIVKQRGIKTKMKHILFKRVFRKSQKTKVL